MNLATETFIKEALASFLGKVSVNGNDYVRTGAFKKRVEREERTVGCREQCSEPGRHDRDQDRDDCSHSVRAPESTRRIVAEESRRSCRRHMGELVRSSPSGWSWPSTCSVP